MYEQSRDLPDKTAAGWSGGKVSPLIYVLVETCWISPIHFSAMPLLWQPVCKYLLTLTRTKQCHCTSQWFSLHVWTEYACVRHWNIHTAVVCIPGNRQLIHVRVYVQMSFVDVEIASVLFGVWLVCQAQTQASCPCSFKNLFFSFTTLHLHYSTNNVLKLIHTVSTSILSEVWDLIISFLWSLLDA